MGRNQDEREDALALDSLTDSVLALKAERDELLTALRGILGGQLTGGVDLDAPRFQVAREAVAKANAREYWHRCPKCDRPATFPRGIDGLHRCSRCAAEFLPLEVMGWMQP